jgi:hypothetical protein
VEANSLRSDSLLYFSSSKKKSKAPHRAGKKAKPSGRQPKRQGQPREGLAFVFVL